jgi:hypothetical protein
MRRPTAATVVAVIACSVVQDSVSSAMSTRHDGVGWRPITAPTDVFVTA